MSNEATAAKIRDLTRRINIELQLSQFSSFERVEGWAKQILHLTASVLESSSTDG